MTVQPRQRDPRSIITPDAFEVSPALLGSVLASPSRRLSALAVDLLVIGSITALTRSSGLILGVVAAVFFIRAGFRRTAVRGSVFGRAMRASVGCLGMLIAGVTLIVWVVGSAPDRGRDGSFLSGGVTVGEGDQGPAISVDGSVESVLSQVLRGLSTASASAALEGAQTLAEAETAARDLVQAGRELGLPQGDLRLLVLEAVPEDAPWAADAPVMIDRLLGEGGGRSTVELLEPRDVQAIQDEVGLYTLEEALGAYATVLGGSAQGDLDLVRQGALRRRLAGELAGDSLRSLTLRVQALERSGVVQRDALTEMEARLEAAEGGGLVSWLLDVLDEIGFGFGWASLYLTVMMSRWNGQTVGKRLLGIRVVRLDGEPITWWVAFERAGGYAAGFATGLLGFAQVYWDANRQGIHDRIVGTVVIVEGAERVLHWESAL